MTVLIKSTHCKIELLNGSHAQLMSQYYRDNKSHFSPWEPKRTKSFYDKHHWLGQAHLSQELFNKKQALHLIALNHEKTQVIATCNFNNIIWGSFQACHLGYSIDKSHEGKGIMFEVVSACIGFVKDEFKLHRIMANHLPHNYRSEKLLHRLGFEKEGYAKSYLKINGQWQDHILNSLII